MVLMEFSMTPLGTGPSVSRQVARSLDIIDQSGLDYQLNAMGTIVEGDLADVLGVLQRCFEAMQSDCERVTCTAKFDVRKGPGGRISAKVERVENELGRPLSRISPSSGQ